MQLNDLFLAEAPIEDFNLIGNWNRNHSFKKEQDRKILTNPRAQEQIKQRWAKTIVPFKLYFVNVPGLGKYQETGEVSEDWISEKFPEKIAKQIVPNDDAINVVFVGNTATERVPMTAWIIAHRFGHVIARNESNGRGNFWPQVEEFREARNLIFQSMSFIVADYGIKDFPSSQESFDQVRDNYQKNDQILRAIFHEIGTMRSARKHEIRTEFEFTVELLAQYMLTGKIRFNPLPSNIRFGRFGNSWLQFEGDEKELEQSNDFLATTARDLENLFQQALYACVGRIFVM